MYLPVQYIPLLNIQLPVRLICPGEEEGDGIQVRG